MFICIFVISQDWVGVGNRNTPSRNTMACLSGVVNDMITDDFSKQRIGVWASMILTNLSKNILVPTS